MDDRQTLEMADDFEFLLTFLPDGWEGKAKELGALRRCRKVPDAKILLRLLLIHLAEGCSLRETATRAKQGGLVDVSDVTVMDRLHRAGEWFRWMGAELMAQWVATRPSKVFGGPWNVRVVDGTHVKEPGPTGSSWRIHYAVGLPSLRCSELHVTDSQGAGNGETFARFSVERGDLLVGDRAYGLARGIAHVAQAEGDVLVRFGWNNLPLPDGPGREVRPAQAPAHVARHGPGRLAGVRRGRRPRGARSGLRGEAKPSSGRRSAAGGPEKGPEAQRQDLAQNAGRGRIRLRLHDPSRRSGRPGERSGVLSRTMAGRACVQAA